MGPAKNEFPPLRRAFLCASNPVEIFHSVPEEKGFGIIEVEGRNDVVVHHSAIADIASFLFACLPLGRQTYLGRVPSFLEKMRGVDIVSRV